MGSWPSRNVFNEPAQERGLMTSQSYLGSSSSTSNQFYPGFIDPFMMSDVREAFSDFSSRPNSSMVRSSIRSSNRTISHNSTTDKTATMHNGSEKGEEEKEEIESRRSV